MDIYYMACHDNDIDPYYQLNFRMDIYYMACHDNDIDPYYLMDSC